MDKLNTDLLILGAGPGGYEAAFRASELGLKVILVDDESHLGGVCLHRGCIPSKTLLHISKIIEEAKNLSSKGVKFEDPQIDLTEIRKWKNQVIRKLNQGLDYQAKNKKVDFVEGFGSFLNENTLRVVSKKGVEVQISFKNAIIATGSRPTRIKDWPYDSDHYWTSTDALNLSMIPKKLLVIGGGYIGLEMAQVYQNLGSKVTVVEMENQILPNMDQDLVKILKSHLEKLGVEFSTKTKITKIESLKKGMKIYSVKDDQESQNTYDKVLVSVGRTPNSTGLGSIDLELTKEKFIKINDQLKTSIDHIYAIGDVTGNPMLAHRASHQGIVAAEVISGKKSRFSPLVIPEVIYTHPALSWCGPKISDLSNLEIEFKELKFPWQANGKAVATDAKGLTKLVINQKNGQVIAGGVVGEGADHLISEIALAVEMNAHKDDLSLTIHPHPTISETIMEAARV
jgi:dihydrolipoamide dehydrogenase